MKIIKLGLRRLFQILVSSLTSVVIMEKFFSELKDANYIIVQLYGVLILFALMLCYEKPLKTS